MKKELSCKSTVSSWWCARFCNARFARINSEHRAAFADHKSSATMRHRVVAELCE